MINPFQKKKENATYSLSEIDRGHHKVTYRGVPCIKCPFDYVMYQMIIHEIKPDLLIEIGTNHGGSAFYIADIMDSIGKGQVHTIDIDDRSYPGPKTHPRISFFYDGWEKYDLRLTKEYETVMVIEDSSHTYENTLGVLEKFAPSVTNEAYFIVEDGIIDALGLSDSYNGGPVRAINQFLSEHPEFKVDTRWTNMFGRNATFNINGYLKKAV